MNGKLPMGTCRKRLAVLWFGGGGFVFLTLFAQTLSGRYGDRVDQAWGWMLPSVMPTLSLIIGVLVVSSRRQVSSKATVDGFFFRLAWCLSAVYLVTVAATVFVQPFTRLPPQVLMERSNLWLGPMQGLVTGSLAAFFFRSSD